MFGSEQLSPRLVATRPGCTGRYVYLARLVGLVLLLLGGAAMPLQAQQASDVCDRALAAADDQYRDAEYEEALRLVSACLNQSNRSEEQSLGAYRRLALIHLKRDELDQARAAVVNLLGVDATYEADPVANPPAYVSLVSVVKENLQQAPPTDTTLVAEPSGRKPFFRRTSTWVLLGGVLVGGGVAAAVAGGGGGGGSGSSSPLPVPPVLPSAP
jgi:hypothetical protein